MTMGAWQGVRPATLKVQPAAAEPAGDAAERGVETHISLRICVVPLKFVFPSLLPLLAPIFDLKLSNVWCLLKMAALE